MNKKKILLIGANIIVLLAIFLGIKLFSVSVEKPLEFTSTEEAVRLYSTGDWKVGEIRTLMGITKEVNLYKMTFKLYDDLNPKYYTEVTYPRGSVPGLVFRNDLKVKVKGVLLKGSSVDGAVPLIELKALLILRQ